MYPLEASDEYGLQGLKDKADLIEWLDSWLRDPDSTECKLQKLTTFNPEAYV